MKTCEHSNGWQNRMVWDDLRVLMSSLLHLENMRGQVQMVYSAEIGRPAKSTVRPDVCRHLKMLRWPS